MARPETFNMTCMNLIEAGRDYEALEGHLAQFVEYAATMADSALAARRRELRRAAAVDPERLEATSQAGRPAIGCPRAVPAFRAPPLAARGRAGGSRMAKIIVLGAGMVGRAMALDLARRHEVTATDVDESALRALGRSATVETSVLDVRDAARLAAAVAGFDLVVGAVPGFLGFETLATVIDAGKDVALVPRRSRVPVETG